MASGAPPMGDLPPGPPLNPLLLTGPDVRAPAHDKDIALKCDTEVNRISVQLRTARGTGGANVYLLPTIPNRQPRPKGLWQVLLSFEPWAREAHASLCSPRGLRRRASHDGLDDLLGVENLCVRMGKPYGVTRNTLVICRAQPYRGLPFVGLSAVLTYTHDLSPSRNLEYAYMSALRCARAQIIYGSQFTVIQFARASSLIDVDGALDHVYIAWLSTSAFCDLLVCGSLLHVLFGAQRQLAMGPTRPMISRVITLTMETTVLTTVAAAVSAILSATLPQTRFHFMMFLMLMKIYSNTLLTTLNARNPRNRKLEGGTEVVFWSDMPSSRTRVGPTGTSATTSLPAMQFAVPLQERRSEGRDHQDTAVDDLSVWKRGEESASGHWEP
ncbi:uncharacterized protein SCHCODRAFT_01105508 [Schizophyllum commune H4-8]|nr:uncharacterized protein SCHCODRAFT_01105508 [Schizophyllum commune H4-8]KAI5887224.1 hypothetical protein SCHCODRAFT_01105508 [Schizophyllum commune H4-8]